MGSLSSESVPSSQCVIHGGNQVFATQDHSNRTSPRVDGQEAVNRPPGCEPTLDGSVSAGPCAQADGNCGLHLGSECRVRGC